MFEEEKILQFAYEIRSDIFDRNSSASTMVKKYFTLLQYKNEHNDLITGELLGFYGDKKVPEYRLIYFKSNIFSDKYDTSYEVKNPIAILENNLNSGMKIDLKTNFSSISRTVMPDNILYILEGVRNIILELVNKIIIELEYIDVNYKIFHETKVFVEGKLRELNSSILLDLIDSYNNLKKVSDTNSASKIAFSCRRILQDFMDIIYKDDFLPDGYQEPSKSQIKNKLEYSLTNVKSKTNKKLIITQIEYFSKLVDFIQKNIHPTDYKLYKEDANRCIIYTYLIIGDILKIIQL